MRPWCQYWQSIQMRFHIWKNSIYIQPLLVPTTAQTHLVKLKLSLSLSLHLHIHIDTKHYWCVRLYILCAHIFASLLHNLFLYFLAALPRLSVCLLSLSTANLSYHSNSFFYIYNMGFREFFRSGCLIILF